MTATARALPPRRAPGVGRLLVMLVLCVWLPALLAAAALVAVQACATRDGARESLRSQAALLSGVLHRRMDAIREHLEVLAREVPDDGGDWEAFDRHARRVQAAARVDGVVLLRPDGRHVVDTRLPWGAPLPQSSPTDLPQTARTGRSRWMDLTVGPVSRNAIVGLAIPVIRDGQVRYSLAGVLDVGRVQELVPALPQGWIATIFDGRGRVLAQAPLPGQFVGRQVTPQARARAGPGPTGVFETVTLDGVPVLAALDRLPPSGWTAMVGVPAEILYAPVWSSALAIAAGAAVLLLVALVLALRLRRHIVRSMADLVDEAHAVSTDASARPLAFREASELRERVRANASALARTRAEIDRVHALFERAFVAGMDRRHAQVADWLHDRVGTTLAGLALLSTQLRPASAAAHEMVRTLQRQAQHAAVAARQISLGVMPAGEQQGGLPAALEQLAHDCGGFGRRCAFRHRGDFSDLPAAAAAHLYRIAQEALGNAVRHGRPRRIRVLLARHGTCCRLTVDDDGAGYAAGSPELGPAPPGMGLRSMRARAHAIDGSIAFTRSPLGGARVRVTLDWPG